MKQLAYVFVLLILIASCNDVKQSTNTNKTKLARVDNAYLYLEDVQVKLPSFSSPEDSVEFVKYYINSWMQNQVIISKSEEFLENQKEEINQKVENYKESLLIHAYEKEYIRQKLDTIVSNSEIETYYNQNQKNFLLKEVIVKPLYFKLPEDSKLNKKAKQWYKLYHYDDDLDELYKKISVKTDLFYYDTTNWVYFKDVKSRLPINYSNNVDFVKSKKHYVVTENSTTYYLNIIDYKLNESVSPLSLVRSEIRNIIINKRSQEIRKQLHQNLFEQAKKTGKVETY